MSKPAETGQLSNLEHEVSVNSHSKHETKLKDKVKRGEILSFGTIGCLNNSGYVLVLSSAQSLAHRYNADDFMAVFTFSMAVINVLLTLLNSRYLIKIKYSTRIGWTLILSTAAYSVISASTRINSLFGFIVTILGVIIMGFSFTLGELSMLGFLKDFDPDIVNGWSAGTGFAGLFATSLNLVLRLFNFPDYLIFLIMIPSNIIYWEAFTYLQVQIYKKPNNFILKSSKNLNAEGISESSVSKEEIDALVNKELSCKNIKKIWPRIGFYVVNIALVYTFEYTIITAFANQSTQRYLKNDRSEAQGSQAFIVLTIFYQIGVSISRSSLNFYKVKHIEIPTMLQIINAVAWFFVAFYTETNIILLCVWMLWVGIMGGVVYANIVYMIINNKAISQTEKEISMNILNLFNFLGIILGSVLSFLLENVIMK